MSSDKDDGRVTGLVFSPWNLLLLIPFVILFTPIYNRESPALFGMPFFYWFQFAVIIVGVLSTITVYRMTRRKPVVRGGSHSPDSVDVDRLDEGSVD